MTCLIISSTVGRQVYLDSDSFEKVPCGEVSAIRHIRVVQWVQRWCDWDGRGVSDGENLGNIRRHALRDLLLTA